MEDNTEDYKNVILWVAWMSRWGEPSPTHGYSKGVYTTPDKAADVGQRESAYRGGKYVCQHSPCHLNMQWNPDHFDMPLEQKYPEFVFVASVYHLGSNVLLSDFSESHPHLFSRTHLLGVFTTEKLAEEFAKILYPGWNLQLAKFVVSKQEYLGWTTGNHTSYPDDGRCFILYDDKDGWLIYKTDEDGGMVYPYELECHERFYLLSQAQLWAEANIPPR